MVARTVNNTTAMFLSIACLLLWRRAWFRRAVIAIKHRTRGGVLGYHSERIEQQTVSEEEQ
jgi:hypothetical protein